jgi:5'-deoxynucleotidase YfbR-like HD superfamily hydrolase
MMKLYKQACKLSNIRRFAGVKLGMEYSGAEHSYRVAILSALIVDEYNSLPSTKEKISREEAVMKSLLHDIEESVVGDIPTPVKLYPGLRDLLRKASEEIVREQIVDKELPNAQEYIKFWVEDKENETGEVLTIADKLEALMSAAYEIHRGNQDLQQAYINIQGWFDSNEAKRLLEKFPITQKFLQESKDLVVIKLTNVA